MDQVARGITITLSFLSSLGKKNRIMNILSKWTIMTKEPMSKPGIKCFTITWAIEIGFLPCPVLQSE